MSKKIKKFLVFIIIFAAIIWGALLLSRRNAPSTAQNANPLASSVGSGSASPAGNTGQNHMPSADFSSMLSSVRSISIDMSIFSNPAYKALRDHPIALGTDVIGRTNPFAPVGADSGEVSINPTVQTLQPGKVTSASAELSAQVSFSTTAPVSVVFQYGTTDEFGSVTSPQTLTKSGTAVATISGLASDTTYYVQAVAVVGSTTTTGNTMMFTTTTPPAQ